MREKRCLLIEKVWLGLLLDVCILICLTGYFKACCLIENYAMPLVEKDGFDADGSRDSGQDHIGTDG
jgi:hypothetical protein